VPLVKGFHEDGQAFPEGVLFTSADRKQSGLKGEVFSNQRLDGDHSAMRVDKQIDLQWDEAQPAASIPTTKASIRWTGVLIPPATGEYIMSVAVEGLVRLLIDGKPVIDAWKKNRAHIISNPVQLNAGQVYNVQLEYGQTTPKGRIQFGWRMPGKDDALDRAMAAAAQADHIVLTLGLTPDLEGEEMSVKADGFKGGDRTTIQLPATQKELLEKVCALKKPTVVILTTGSAVSFDVSKPDAILEAWYYGQRGGDAVAQALLGEYNPAGRLPVTFYRSDADLPPFESYSMSNRTYRYFTGQPLYAFGHGLSYTTFDYRKMNLSSKSATASDTITVSVKVTDSGKRDGDEVVQIYATAVNPPVPMPLRQLVGFKRVSFTAGESKTVEIPVPLNLLRHWDDQAHHYVVDPGAYQFTAGPASDQPLLTASLKVVP